jgi:bis(5'-adenosyl)-triphosphatase
MSSASSVPFGPFSIPSSHVFYTSPSASTHAFVNLKPIVPGHVLVSPARSVPRLQDLTDEEHADLFRTVRAVQSKIETRCSASASNVAIQDGLSAGQSVPHVHVHIVGAAPLPLLRLCAHPTPPQLPRSTGDLPEDAIYAEIESWHPWSGEKRGAVAGGKMEMPEVRVDRTTEMMAEEATSFRALFR